MSERRGRSSRPMLSGAQRVVISIGAGLSLFAVGRAAETRGGSAGGGWFSYVPLGSIPEPPFLYLHQGVRLLMWLLLIAAWVAVSLWLFQGHERGGVAPSDPPTAARPES